MRKTLLRTALATGLIVALAATAAQGIELRAGKIIIVADGGFTPTKLPQHRNAPINLHGFAKFSTIDGTRPSPLIQLVIEFDKHGAVETRGLPVCTQQKLIATTVERARANCRGSIVGTGFGSAVVELPEQRPIKASSPLTLFNGPRKNGNPTVLGHAHLDYPAPTTYVVPIEIERINKGRYGYRTIANFPKIANYYGSPTYGRLKIGKRWTYRGKRLSYVNARCPDGRLQARGSVLFKDGSFAKGNFLRPCQIIR
ncbi:MAG TPA: hypothetical protein VFY04_03785 [Solirubrobacterales bacterium]|nr:hypothetical protein [Solirubrobacterales bacterium]